MPEGGEEGVVRGIEREGERKREKCVRARATAAAPRSLYLGPFSPEGRRPAQLREPSGGAEWLAASEATTTLMGPDRFQALGSPLPDELLPALGAETDRQPAEGSVERNYRFGRFAEEKWSVEDERNFWPPFDVFPPECCNHQRLGHGEE